MRLHPTDDLDSSSDRRPTLIARLRLSKPHRRLVIIPVILFLLLPGHSTFSLDLPFGLGSTPCADMLRVDNFSSAGWFLEYYMSWWVFDSRVYAEIARTYAQTWPQLEGNPQEVFFEVCYFAYIWAEKGPVEGPAYRFITSEQLLGQRLWNLMWPRYVYETGADPNERVNDLSIIEDVREWLARFPNLLIPVAEAWERNQMRLFKAGQDWWQAMAFLGVAKSVRMCVSEQPRDLYEAAIWGHFNLE